MRQFQGRKRTFQAANPTRPIADWQYDYPMIILWVFTQLCIEAALENLLVLFYLLDFCLLDNHEIYIHILNSLSRLVIYISIRLSFVDH